MDQVAKISIDLQILSCDLYASSEHCTIDFELPTQNKVDERACGCPAQAIDTLTNRLVELSFFSIVLFRTNGQATKDVTDPDAFVSAIAFHLLHNVMVDMLEIGRSRKMPDLDRPSPTPVQFGSQLIQVARMTLFNRCLLSARQLKRNFINGSQPTLQQKASSQQTTKVGFYKLENMQLKLVIATK